MSRHLRRRAASGFVSALVCAFTVVALLTNVMPAAALPAQTVGFACAFSDSSFATGLDFATGADPLTFALADMDGDGKLDIVTANTNSSSLSVLRNTSTSGSVSLAPKVDLIAGSRPETVAIGDIDGDGKPDVVSANSGATTISLFRNTSTPGSLSFGARANVSAGAAPIGVALADINTDGKLDVIVTNGSTANTISVLRNQSTSGSITTSSLAARVPFATGTGPLLLTTGDVDGDGLADIVTTNLSANNVSVLRNTGGVGVITSASLATRVNFPVGQAPVGVALVDVDGDGKRDIVTGNSTGNTVSVLRNTSTSGAISSASFASAVDFVVGTTPQIVVAADVDGDGKPDILVANNADNTVSILRNTSTSGSITSASFASKVDLPTGTSPVGVGVADMDGDGKPDIVVTNAGANTVSIHRNICVPPTATPTPTPSPSATPTATATATPIPSATATSTLTPTPIATATASVTSTSTPQPVSSGGQTPRRPAPTAVLDHVGEVGGGSAPPGLTPPSAVVMAPPPASLPVSPGDEVPIVVEAHADGASTAVPSDGVIHFNFNAPDAPGLVAQGSIRLNQGLIAAVPTSITLRVVVDDQPTPPDAAQPARLGGGAAQPLAAPVDFQIIAIDRDSGLGVPLPREVGDQLIEVRLPVLASPDPNAEAVWLMEVDDDGGGFLGYVRPPSSVDPLSNQVVLTLAARQLRGTLFLPVVLRLAYVRNFDPLAHMWSSPFADAIDFGIAAPQWTRMRVLAPQVGRRLPVLNTFTGEPGWVEAAGVGPVDLHDGAPDAPTGEAVPTEQTPTVDQADGPDTRPATIYVVRPGDTLKGIAAQSGNSLLALIAANPEINPDQLRIGQQLQLPSP